MANGLQLVSPVASGSGLAQAGAQGINDFTNLVKELAFFNLQNQKQQEMQNREDALRQQLLSQQQAQQTALQESAQQQQTDIQASQQKFLAHENELDRAMQAKLAKIKANQDENPFEAIFKAATVSKTFGLDPKDPDIFGILNKKDFSGLQDTLRLQTSIEQNIIPILQSRDKQKELFGRRLAKDETELLTELAQRAISAPQTYGPKLTQALTEIKAKQPGPGLFSRMGSGISDLLMAIPQAPQGSSTTQPSLPPLAGTFPGQ